MDGDPYSTFETIRDLHRVMPRLARLLEHEVLGTVAPGAQISLRSGSTVLNIAVGIVARGEELRSDMSFLSWCLTKPIVALAALGAASAQGISLDDSMAIGDYEVPAFVTLRNLLSHSCGLRGPGHFGAYLTRKADLDEQVRQAVASATPGTLYSEYVAWRLLGEFIDQHPGGREELLAMALQNVEHREEAFFSLSPDELRTKRFKIGMYASSFPSAQWTPGLHDRSVSACSADRLGFGGYVSMRAYREFLDAVSGARLHSGFAGDLRPMSYNSTAVELLNECLRRPTDIVSDPVLNRRMSYAGGFWVNRGFSVFGDLFSERAFGHCGYLGTSIGLHDPEREMTLSILLNVIPAHPERFRKVIDHCVSAILYDLGQLDGSSSLMDQRDRYGR